MRTSKKPHDEPFPRAEAADSIKERLRRKVQEERAAAEREASEAKRRAEEETRRKEEDKRRAAEAEAARKSARPWRKAWFAHGNEDKVEALPVEELPSDARVREHESTRTREHERTGEQEHEGKNREDVNESLEAIYVERGGDLPDLSKLERRRSRRWLLALVTFAGFLGALAAIAWVGLLLFQPFREFTGEGLVLGVTGPDRIALGREETFDVAWRNPRAEALDDVQFRIGLPHDFVLTSAVPVAADAEKSLWKLGRIASGARGSIKIRGFFIGELGSENAVQALATFRPAGFSKTAEALATLNVKYADTVLTGLIQTPPKVLSGDTVAIKYLVANRGTQALKNYFARVETPIGFVAGTLPTSTRRGESERELFIPLGTLAPKSTSTAQIIGTFVSGMSGDATVLASAGRFGEGDKFLVAQTTETRIPVLAGDFTVRFVVNGADADRSILPGEPLRLAVSYQNTSPEPIRGVTLTVNFESLVNGASATGTSLLDWTRLEDFTQGVSSTKPRLQSVRYGKDQIATFELLSSQSEGLIELALPTLPVASGTKDAMIRLTVQAAVAQVGETKVNRTVRSQPITIRYRTDADLLAEARYFTEEGAPLGFGPLPPVAGKTTGYRIIWRVSKKFHPLENLTVTAVLPKIAAWSGKTLVDAGEIAYDEPTRTVRWTLNRMPDEVKELEAQFEVQVTPEAIDVGRFATVLGESRFVATDAAAGEAVTRAKPPISTDLQSDDGARGKGVVRKE